MIIAGALKHQRGWLNRLSSSTVIVLLLRPGLAFQARPINADYHRNITRASSNWLWETNAQKRAFFFFS